MEALEEDEFKKITKSTGKNKYKDKDIYKTDKKGKFETDKKGNKIFDKAKATKWLQRELGVKDDGDFGTGSKQAALKSTTIHQLKNAIKDKGFTRKQRAKVKKLLKMARVAFGEFGTSGQISSKDFERYAKVVISTLINRLSHPEWKGQSLDKIMKGYNAVTDNEGKGSDAYQIFGGHGKLDDKYTNMSISDLIKFSQNIKTSINAAAQAVATGKPFHDKGLVFYYSPDGMKPKGSKPKTWDFKKLKRVKTATKDNLLKAYKYK